MVIIMDSEEPFKRGYLSTPPQGKILKRSWQRRYYALYQASNLGVERVEVFDSESQYERHCSPNKLIPLNDCIKVVQAPQKQQQNVFEVISKNQIRQFSVATTQELAEWIAAFQTVAFGSLRRESFPMIHLPATRDSTLEHPESLQEENMIYSSVSKPEIYGVEVIDSEPSERCGLHGFYQLVVTPLHISVSPAASTCGSGKALFTWPYRHIRRFSQNKKTFSFEAGRKCASGPGVFEFRTKEGTAIFQSVSVYLKSFSKDGDASSNSSTDKSVSFALPTNKGANSSSSTTTNLQNNAGSKSKLSSSNQPETNNRSHSDSPKSSITTEENLYENTLVGALRPPITKPPRKTKLPSASNSKHSTSSDPICSSHDSFGISPPKHASSLEAVSSPTGTGTTEFNDSVFEPDSKPPQMIGDPSELLYDVPEERKDAWKTHGLENDNIHQENIPASDDHGPLYASVDVTTTPPTKVPILKRFMSAPEVLSLSKEESFFRQVSVFQSPTHESNDSYDHLFQFGPQHPKTPTNTNPEHIYRKLSPVRSLLNVNVSTESAEQQQQQRQQLEPPTPPPPTPSTPPEQDGAKGTEQNVVKHFVQNNEVYSVIVKPNRQTNSHVKE